MPPSLTQANHSRVLIAQALSRRLQTFQGSLNLTTVDHAIEHKAVGACLSQQDTANEAVWLVILHAAPVCAPKHLARGV